jgi:hypothetical protein
VSPSGRDPLNHGALAAAVRAGTPLLGTFIGGASPVAAAVTAEFGRARSVTKPQQDKEPPL